MFAENESYNIQGMEKLDRKSTANYLFCGNLAFGSQFKWSKRVVVNLSFIGRFQTKTYVKCKLVNLYDIKYKLIMI